MFENGDQSTGKVFVLTGYPTCFLLGLFKSQIIEECNIPQTLFLRLKKGGRISTSYDCR